MDVDDAADARDSREMFQHLPFPFPDGRFPSQLGAVVQLSVLEGREPARLVLHSEDNSWAVGDGINDPNVAGASVATHFSHALRRNSALAELASLPAGHQATRDGPGHPWVITPADWEA